MENQILSALPWLLPVIIILAVLVARIIECDIAHFKSGTRTSSHPLNAEPSC